MASKILNNNNNNKLIRGVDNLDQFIFRFFREELDQEEKLKRALSGFRNILLRYLKRDIVNDALARDGNELSRNTMSSGRQIRKQKKNYSPSYPFATSKEYSSYLCIVNRSTIFHGGR